MTRRRIHGLLAAVLLCLALALACVFCACSSEGGYTDSADDVTGLSLPEKIVLNYGDTYSLFADVDTSNSKKYIGEIAWTTSDGSVAALYGAGGNVTACGVGEAVITAAVPGTGYSAECVVTVTRGTFRVGVKDDVKGFGYRGDDGELSGMEIEMAGMIADALGYDDTDFVVVDPDDRENYLVNGYVDCIVATYTRTSSRAELVNFSSAYYTDSVAVLAGAEYAELGSLEAISSYVCEYGEDDPQNTDVEITPCRVAYVEGSTAKSAFEEYCDLYDIPMANMSLGAELFEFVPCKDYSECEKALEGEVADLFVSDRCILSTYMGEGTAFLSDRLGEQEYCVATAKIDEDEGYVESDTSVSMSITAKVNALIDGWIEEGFMADLMEKYGLAV